MKILLTGANGYSLSIPTINSWGLNGSAYFTINPTTANVNIGAISVNTAVVIRRSCRGIFVRT